MLDGIVEGGAAKTLEIAIAGGAPGCGELRQRGLGK